MNQLACTQPVFKHYDFYVFNKPAGCDFHNDGDRLGFFALIKASYPTEKLYPVHRLDKETSGLLIVARSLAAEHRFKDLFEQHQIDKFYLALSSANKVRKKQGCIKGDMVRSRNKSWRLLKTLNNPAITYFKSYSLIPGKRWYLLNPISGKTHQLRVMMKAIGAPIDGDTIYKGVPAQRLYLHAAFLRFVYQGETIEIVKLPNQEDFAMLALEHERLELKSPWALDWPKTKNHQKTS